MEYYFEYPLDGKTDRVIVDAPFMPPIGKVLTYYPHRQSDGSTLKTPLELKVVDIELPPLRANWIRTKDLGVPGKDFSVHGLSEFDKVLPVVKTELVQI